MALSEGKEKKKRWSAIFVAVDGLLYMPNESSALSDGFVTSFLGRTEPTCSTFKPCKRSVPSPAIFFPRKTCVLKQSRHSRAVRLRLVSGKPTRQPT